MYESNLNFLSRYGTNTSTTTSTGSGTDTVEKE